MKTRLLVALLFLSTINSQPSTCFAQGSLTPPGPPAPTMKTLDQIEPRIPINSLPFTITQSGSYYLTKSFEQDFTGNAITIQADNVAVNLEGALIRDTVPGVSNGILVLNASSGVAIRNVTVKNGILAGFGTAAGGNGVLLEGAKNCLVEDMLVVNSDNGFGSTNNSAATSAGNIFRRCRASDNSSNGFKILGGAGNIQNVIERCDALNNATGFLIAQGGNLIVNCRASGNTTNNYNIAISNRMGAIVVPTANATAITGNSSGSVNSGTTDPFASISY